MAAERRSVRVYILGVGFPVTEAGERLYSLPYTVCYAPDYKSGPFYLGSGDGRNGSGTFLSTVEILKPQWRSDLMASEGGWLLPLLERLPPGEDPDSADILEAYKQKHGTPPPSEGWALFGE